MKLKINLRNILSVKIHKIVLLLLALCIYNTAYGQNQRISVYGNNQSLQKVFEQIEQQTKYLANAAYVKLQNITLSYTLPKAWSKQVYFDEVKVFFSGENLHTWDHLPEGLESDMLSKGAWEYPFMKKFSLGFNVTF